MSGYTHSGHVYFAVVGDYVKIGYSSLPVGERMKSLFNTGRLICPDDMVRSEPQLVHVIPGCVIRDERRLHGLFAAYHAIGEWHHYNDAFREHLAGLNYMTYKQGLAELRRVRRELKQAGARAVTARAAA